MPRRSLTFAVFAAACFGGTAARAHAEELERSSPMPRRTVERPLTLMEDMFAVFGTGGIGQLTANDSLVTLGAGAEYGVNKQVQVSLLLLRLSITPHPS